MLSIHRLLDKGKPTKKLLTVVASGVCMIVYTCTIALVVILLVVVAVAAIVVVIEVVVERVIVEVML